MCSPTVTCTRCIHAKTVEPVIYKNQPYILDSKQAFRDIFYKARGRLNKSGFEESFTELLEAFPKAEKYLMQLYHDGERWALALSPLSFCVASWTTNSRRYAYCVLHIHGCVLVDNIARA